MKIHCSNHMILPLQIQTLSGAFYLTSPRNIFNNLREGFLHCPAEPNVADKVSPLPSGNSSPAHFYHFTMIFCNVIPVISAEY